jgi:hypothetical protein
MNNPLDKLQRKYSGAGQGRSDHGVPAGQAGPVNDPTPDKGEYVPGARGWQGCASICLLHLYMYEHPDLGAFVGIAPDGQLVMRFRPPLGREDDGGKRFCMAVEAVALFVAARDDIRRLVDNGDMSIRRFTE